MSGQGLDRENAAIEFSVIIPVFNEEASILPLGEQLLAVMRALGKPFEIIFVDDCSTDKTAEAVCSLSGYAGLMVLVRLARHEGQSAALQAGFEQARGDILITLDGDLQNDPRDIPRLLARLNAGYDLVCGWRQKRHDPSLRRLSSGVARLFRRALLRDRVHDVGCTLRVFKRAVAEGIALSPGMHRFFTLIAQKRGFSIAEERVAHAPRAFGVSKYNVRNRLFIGLGHCFLFAFSDVKTLCRKERTVPVKEVVFP